MTSKYLVNKRRPKSAAHIWLGKDTACKLASTGGLQIERYTTEPTACGRKVCRMCEVNKLQLNVESRKQRESIADECLQLVLDYVRESELSPEATRTALVSCRDALNAILGGSAAKPAEASNGKYRPTNGDLFPNAPADDDAFPMGKFGPVTTRQPEGECKTYGEVPGWYYRRIAAADWIEDWPEVLAYIRLHGFDESDE